MFDPERHKVVEGDPEKATQFAWIEKLPIEKAHGVRCGDHFVLKSFTRDGKPNTIKTALVKGMVWQSWQRQRRLFFIEKSFGVTDSLLVVCKRIANVKRIIMNRKRYIKEARKKNPAIPVALPDFMDAIEREAVMLVSPFDETLREKTDDV